MDKYRQNDNSNTAVDDGGVNDSKTPFFTIHGHQTWAGMTPKSCHSHMICSLYYRSHKENLVKWIKSSKKMRLYLYWNNFHFHRCFILNSQFWSSESKTSHWIQISCVDFWRSFHYFYHFNLWHNYIGFWDVFHKLAEIGSIKWETPKNRKIEVSLPQQYYTIK